MVVWRSMIWAPITLQSKLDLDFGTVIPSTGINAKWNWSFNREWSKRYSSFVFLWLSFCYEHWYRYTNFVYRNISLCLNSAISEFRIPPQYHTCSKPQSPSIPEWYVIYLELVRVTLLNNWWMRTPIYPYNEVGEPTRLRYNLDLANVNENNLKRAIVVFVAIANFAPNQMNKITWRTWIMLFSVRKARYTIALWWESSRGISSYGRATASHAVGRGIDTLILQIILLRHTFYYFHQHPTKITIIYIGVIRLNFHQKLWYYHNRVLNIFTLLFTLNRWLDFLGAFDFKNKFTTRINLYFWNDKCGDLSMKWWTIQSTRFKNRIVSNKATQQSFRFYYETLFIILKK